MSSLIQIDDHGPTDGRTSLSIIETLSGSNKQGCLGQYNVIQVSRVSKRTVRLARSIQGQQGLNLPYSSQRF